MAKEEFEEHFLSEDLYKLIKGEMTQADFTAYWGTEICYDSMNALITIKRDGEYNYISVE